MIMDEEETAAMGQAYRRLKAHPELYCVVYRVGGTLLYPQLAFHNQQELFAFASSVEVGGTGIYIGTAFQAKVTAWEHRAR